MGSDFACDQKLAHGAVILWPISTCQTYCQGQSCSGITGAMFLYPWSATGQRNAGVAAKENVDQDNECSCEKDVFETGVLLMPSLLRLWIDR